MSTPGRRHRARWKTSAGDKFTFLLEERAQSWYEVEFRRRPQIVPDGDVCCSAHRGFLVEKIPKRTACGPLEFFGRALPGKVSRTADPCDRVAQLTAADAHPLPRAAGLSGRPCFLTGCSVAAPSRFIFFAAPATVYAVFFLFCGLGILERKAPPAQTEGRHLEPRSLTKI